MAWVRLDDQFFLRPRVRSAGPEGRALYIAGLCYASQNLTDGHLPAAAIPLVAAMAEVEPSIADHLVTIGLWVSVPTATQPVPPGYQIIDFLIYNPSRQQVTAEREAAAERQRRSRASRNTSRRDSAVTSPDPVPVPVPPSDLSLSSSGNSRANGLSTGDDGEISTADVPNETWQHYADLRLGQQTAKVANPAGWKKTTAQNAQIEHADQAARWWHTYELTPYRLAQCLVDGRAPRHVPRRPGAA